MTELDYYKESKIRVNEGRTGQRRNDVLQGRNLRRQTVRRSRQGEAGTQVTRGWRRLCLDYSHRAAVRQPD